MVKVYGMVIFMFYIWITLTNVRPMQPGRTADIEIA